MEFFGEPSSGGPVELAGAGGAIQRRPVELTRCGVGGEPSSGVGGRAVQREAQWTSGAQQWIIGGGGVTSGVELSVSREPPSGVQGSSGAQ